MTMKHGGDTYTYSKLYQENLIDFSSNINPLGYPKGLEFEWIKDFKNARVYPDIKYKALRESIGDYLACSSDEVVVGNGSMEIIDAVICNYSTVQFFIPSFGEYEERAKIRNKNIISIAMDESMTIDFDILEESLKEESLLIVGNPNNPTGLRLAKDKLLKLYQIIRDKKGLLVLDEAFYEFCSQDYDSIELFKPYEYENILIIRAATKFFGLPGIRLGYACGNKKLAETIRNQLNPWSINCFAEIAGNYIFKDLEYIEKSKEYIANERDYLLKELGSIQGLFVYPSHANFILIKLLDKTEDQALQHFLAHGILLRTCDSFSGLEGAHVRVAIRSHEENSQLIQVFKDFLKEEEDVH